MNAEMTARQHAVKLAILKAIREWLDQIDADIRRDARAAFEAGDRISARLDDGTVVGSVTMTNPRSGWKVADKAAFLAWCKEHRPSAVVVEESVRASDQKLILAQINQSGEVPDGVVEYEGSPTLSVRPDYDVIHTLDWRPLIEDTGLPQVGGPQ